MNRIYNDEELDYIRECAESHSSAECYEMFLERFPSIQIKKPAFRDLARRHGIVFDVKCKSRSIFSDEVKQFIKDNAKGITVYDLAKIINDKFGTSYTGSQIKEFKVSNKIRSGWITPRGGNVTSFKKGCSPVNKKEVGSLVLRADGYIYVKVENENNTNYRTIHRMIYDLWHPSEPLKKDEVVIYKDGNKYNFAKENMMKINVKELGYVNSYMNQFELPITEQTVDIRNTLVNLGRLEQAIKEE